MNPSAQQKRRQKAGRSSYQSTRWHWTKQELGQRDRDTIYSRTFNVERGVIQGNIISPVLSILALDTPTGARTRQTTKPENMCDAEGSWSSECWANADDAALISQNDDVMTERLTVLEVNDDVLPAATCTSEKSHGHRSSSSGGRIRSSTNVISSSGVSSQHEECGYTEPIACATTMSLKRSSKLKK